MFQAIDADSDGVITKVELRKAIVALRKLDINKDGKITLAETETLRNAAGANGPAGLGGPNRFGKGRGGFAPNGDPRPGGPNMLQFDRNGDGNLSADEVPPHLRQALGSADQDRNGVIDAVELTATQQRLNERARGQRRLPAGLSVGPQGVEPSQ
jgi:Ca2+-binding EF-hand superfamily protein